MEFLIKKGANVKAECNNGRTALSYAAEQGYGNVVRSLLEHGTNASTKDNDGKTPLGYATEKGHNEIIEMLGGYEEEAL
ncbi:Ankyrin-2 [Cladobotryum mycophilum]|uniref:Ankyrin-2 n=1 Tax=Cladobotryum mycophilum TaxID=491253 RepID=A0ABR0SHJ0_9HYPO